MMRVVRLIVIYTAMYFAVGAGCNPAHPKRVALAAFIATLIVQSFISRLDRRRAYNPTLSPKSDGWIPL